MSESEEIEKIKAELRQRYERYVERAGLRLNPDKEQVDATLAGLAMRKLKFGKFYCPCKVVTGDPAKDKRIICPCADHKKEIEENGICTCRLFLSKDYREE
ncbi:MAG: ferredoxin:thioredoxin reductase [Planctomycetes bacterium]|nr:ferredoxin:thioredoxin reductase [Planctomycetota bacterium]